MTYCLTCTCTCTCTGDVVRVGSSFRGVVHWHRCVEAEDHYSTITITAVKRSPFFQTRSFVRATVTREYEDHAVSSYTARGYFAYATRRLQLAADPGSPNRVAVICDFTWATTIMLIARLLRRRHLRNVALFVSSESKQQDTTRYWSVVSHVLTSIPSSIPSNLNIVYQI